MLEWNVFVEYNNYITKRNVFNLSIRFNEGLKKIKLKDITYEDFCDKVMKAAMVAFWAKCEYEVTIASNPPFIERKEIERLKDINTIRTDVNLYNEAKVDVYEQLDMNKDRFLEYLWANKDKIKKID